MIYIVQLKIQLTFKYIETLDEWLNGNTITFAIQLN